MTSVAACLPRSTAPVETGSPATGLPTLEVTFEREQCTDAFLDDVVRHRFHFAGETHDLGEPLNWLENPSHDIEWHILLHKFYYAPGLARRAIRQRNGRDVVALQHLVDGWIATVPIGFIAPDVTARRLQNWAYAWHLLREAGRLPTDAGFRHRLYASVAAQTDWLCAHLAPCRNHRTLALHAILVTSIVFAERDAAPRWRAFAVAGMLENIRSDVLDDGVHCELSSDYHHIVLRSHLLFCRLAPAIGVTLPADVRRLLERALDFALHVHRPDGVVPALSDGDARDWRELLRLGAVLFDREDLRFVASEGREGRRPANRSRTFDASGYAVLRSRWEDDGAFRDARWLVFDAGPVGAGNHGHFDALSLEAYAFGRALLVDPGRYTYAEHGPLNWRRAFRDSAAHNTVTVDGLEPGCYRERNGRSKIVAPFPDTRLLEARLEVPCELLIGVTRSPRHDARHVRHVWFVDERYWLVLDCLAAPTVHDYALRWQFTPRARSGTLREVGGGVLFASDDLDLLVVRPRPNAVLEDGWVSARYGQREAAPRLRVSARGRSQRFLTVISPRRTGRTDPTLVPDGRGAPARAGFDIAHDGGRDRWTWDGHVLGRTRLGNLSDAAAEVVWSDAHG